MDPTPAAPPTRRAFISYAHASAQHVEAVRQLWLLLRQCGVDARLDLSAAATRQDWPVWMMKQFRTADYVIVVASAEYRRRAEGDAAADEGRGVQFEGAILRELYYANRNALTSKVLPVLLPGETVDGLPTFLGPTSATTYQVAQLTTAGIEKLLRVITAQPEHPVPPLGPVPRLAPRSSTTVAAPAAPDRSNSRIAELGQLVDAFEAVPEFADAAGRRQILLLLPPHIRGAIDDSPTGRMHIIGILRGCGRFGEAGRTALLEILRAALPRDDPNVRAAIALVESSRVF